MAPVDSERVRSLLDHSQLMDQRVRDSPGPGPRSGDAGVFGTGFTGATTAGFGSRLGGDWMGG